MWFKFIAVGKEVYVNIKGDGQTTNGTLIKPDASLMSGTCDNLNIIRCNSGYNSNNDFVTLYTGNLTIGATYYIRIASTVSNKGNFDLCINNFTTMSNPNEPNDCNNATIVCNKDALSVGTFNGSGLNDTESTLGCFLDAANSHGTTSIESQVHWMTFKCKTSGTLDFDITGAKIDDDIDWILVEIPAIRNCATKTLLSCNVARCDINGSGTSTGIERKTGIRPGEDAIDKVSATVSANSEPVNCSSVSNGYNNTLNITAGKTYALMLNNDDGSSGFSIKWGGSSTFVGPESKIVIDKSSICVGENISVNGSNSLDYTSFEWGLPSESYPNSQTIIGPFSQTFNKIGTYPIVLTTKDNDGCISVKNTMVTVKGINADFTAPSVCVGNPTLFTCTTSGLTGLTWDFGDASTGTGTTINHTYATAGDYTAKLTVIGGTCTNVFSQKVSVLGSNITITPNPAQTCPGFPLTLNATVNVSGNASGALNFTQNTPVTVPQGFYSFSNPVGVNDTWDGTIGTGGNSTASTNVGISTIPVTGLNSNNWKINSISLTINTSKAKYITAYIVNPCGQRIKLIARTSALANGFGFSNISFIPTGTIQIGSSGNTTTPLTGSSYAASESTLWNSSLLNCNNPNGDWKLIVGEYYNISSSGSPQISNWKIDFQSDTPNQIQSIAWSPTTNLTNIAYTGTNTTSGTATAKTTTAETLTLTVADKGGCTTTKQVTVSVSAPSAPTCTGITVCTGQSGTLTATGNSGATFKWYSDNTTTTTISGSGTTGTFTTPNLSALTSYYVSQVSGGCESTRTKVDVNVTNSNGITLTSASGTDDQTVCLNSAITNITYSTTGATGATITGLPTGVSGSWNANVITISGAPTVNTTSPYNFNIALTGGCGSASKTGKITVNNLNTINLSSATGTDNQTLCINTVLTNITYNTTGATGGTVTGLPSGVTGSWSANTVTITGTPTVSSTTPFNYSISLSGGCGTVTKTGNINVNPKQTLGLSCGTSSSTSVEFTWTNIPNATYSYSYLINNTGTATTGTLTSGVTTFSKTGLNPGDIVTLTLTPIGGTCVAAETWSCTAVNCGTPTVNALSPIIDCSNTSITAINFTSPQGTVTFNWSNNNTTIGIPSSGTGNIPTFTSGTVTSQQVATISVTATKSGCTGPAQTFTITINPLNTITLTSPIGTDDQKICKGNSIDDIYYSTTGATDASFTGLPTGITGSWTSNVIKISGSSSVISNSPYTISLIGGCGTISKTGNIKINDLPAINAGLDKEICEGSSIKLVATGGNTYTWNNGVVNDVSFTPTTNLIYTVTGTDLNGCKNTDAVEIKINPLPILNPLTNTPCEQSDLKLDAGFPGAASYSWSGPNGFTESIEKPTISTATLNAKGKYTVTVTDIKNCSKSSDIQVNINPIDNIQFSDIQATCKNNAVFNLPSVNIPGGTWSSDDLTSVTNSTNGVFDPSKSSPDQYYKVVVTYSTKTITSPSRLCPNIFSKVVYVYPTPDTSFLVKENLICITDNLIAEVINPNPNITYTWDFNNGQTLVGDKVNYNYPKGGVFDLTLTAKQGICSNTSVRKQHINVVDLPENIEILQSDTKIDFYNPEIQFKTNSNAKYFYWDFGDGTTSTYKNPKHKFPEKPGQYVVELTASNMLGKCSVSKTSSIFIPEPVIYFIPNTFTPNGDELNNTFQPVFTYGYDPQNYSFYIYSRWGDLIFESHDPKIGWDGTYGENIVQNDTYVWKLEFKEKIEETKHVKTGHVSLLK